MTKRVWGFFQQIDTRTHSLKIMTHILSAINRSNNYTRSDNYQMNAKKSLIECKFSSQTE